MTLKLEGNLDILKIHLQTKNEVATLRHSTLLIDDDMCLANEKNTKIAQSQIHQLSTTSSIPTRHIPTKLHQFPTSSSRDFVRIDTQMHRDAGNNNTCSQHSWHTGEYHRNA